MGFALRANIRGVDENITNSISSLSALLANDDDIIEALITGHISEKKEKNLDTMTNDSLYIDIITVADMDSIRVYHPVKERIGQTFVGGDEKQFTDTINSYVTTEYGTLGKQRRAFHRVFDKNGNALGFVMVSALESNIYGFYKDILISFIPLTILILLLATIFSIYTAFRLRISLLGHSPAEFVTLFKKRNEIFNALEEGLIAIDKNGMIIFANNIAAELYQQDPESLHGKLIREVLPSCKLQRVLRTKTAEYNCEMKINDETVLCDRIPLYEKNQLTGALCIYRNKTELTRMAEELTGVTHIIASLRSNMHEFKNHMHVISGLLQLKEYDTAHKYIDNLNTDSMMLSTVTNCIENKTLAALVYGKINLAREQDITMRINEDTHLPAHNKFLSTNQLVTILGNLLQNSIDAMVDKSEHDDKEIELYIHCDDDKLKITVDDTGCGIAEENLENIYQRGFSTKGTERGIGMNLVYSIVKNRDGKIVVESVLSEGTTISLIFTQTRSM